MKKTIKTYNAKPLVVHRSRPVTQAEVVQRKTRVAQRRLLQGFAKAGKSGRSIEKLRKRRNTPKPHNNADPRITSAEEDDRHLYLEISKEIMEAMRVGGGDPILDRAYEPESKTLSREERIQLHAINAKAKLKEKSGGVPPAIVDYKPPVSASTLHKLHQLNRAEKKLPINNLSTRIHPKIVPSLEMRKACNQQIHGIGVQRTIQRTAQKSSKKHSMKQKDHHLQHDFWENRLTSQLARPLGIEAFIQTSSSSSYVSDNPTLDSVMYRKQDQTRQVQKAYAAGRPVLTALKASRDGDPTPLPPPLRTSTSAPPSFAYNTLTHSATSAIQRVARLRRLYKRISSIKIQSMFRAFLVYREIVRERRRHNLAAACIQCIHRGNAGRRWAMWARFVLKVQQIGRCWLARRIVNERRVRRNGLNLYLGHVHLEAAKLLFVYKSAVKRIQKYWKYLLKWRRDRHGAANVIQCAARLKLYGLRKKYKWCAVLLQKTIGRGALTRIY
jgi:hypothetical protein